ncbi:CBS domain-containing protein [Pseudonocardia sp. KRD-184]|uniref:CBS domain-containing protein n=1 Tax=Pseudonocardia oceani TaxID=2792013 RepID=A0ABS6UHK1_9PSEU|nr:CBS domain-containing protein [Pseudonocardia oceani]MBW0094290.1 CBS domain-containing protein [Pseudonocardia oceani]MBW0100667.1 CBS domain-containing protein [Pseudonocardia oceani]MBW0124084.1 CBS domain-containing protein [Pseudonocardia oceani]MBW0131718.1 CBS domain-containing protein [Pseudonocardia oceani]
MRARDVMSRPVASVRPHASARATATMLVRSGFTEVPVVDAEGLLHGVVSEADLVRALALAPDARDGAGPLVRDVMTPFPAIVGPDADVVEVEQLTRGTGRRSVPVVEHGRLVGVVTRRDLLRAAATSHRNGPTATVPHPVGGS